MNTVTATRSSSDVNVTKLDNYRVSTSNLGPHFGGQFETMVFDDATGDEARGFRRMTTFNGAEAAKNHRSAVNQIHNLRFLASMKVGTVLVSSWGYDQTNVDFYVVTKSGEKSFQIAPCGKVEIPSITMSMARRVAPVVTELGKERFTKRSEKHEHGELCVWDGKPAHETRYC